MPEHDWWAGAVEPPPITSGLSLGGWILNTNIRQRKSRLFTKGPEIGLIFLRRLPMSPTSCSARLTKRDLKGRSNLRAKKAALFRGLLLNV